MSAGRLEKSPSEPPNNFTHPVNRFGIVDRLRLLAPLHRNAAMRRAAEAAGILKDFKFPSLDDLDIAESPPAISWRTEVRGEIVPKPTSADIARGAEELMREPAWRIAKCEELKQDYAFWRAAAAVPALLPRALAFAARREAEDWQTAEWHALNAEPHFVSVPEPGSVTAHERGHALARKHGPLLIALADVLDGLEEVIPQSRLAAMPDHEICALSVRRANDEVERWRVRIEAERAGKRLRLTADGLVDEAEIARLSAPAPVTPHDRRRMCRTWWRRRLRRQAGFARQHLAAALGTVGRGSAQYADDYSLARWRERQEAAAAWAAERVMRHADATTTPMAQVIAAGQQGALHRLGAVMRGIDEIAERDMLTPIMITLTLPPEWHPAPAVGCRTWTAERSPQITDAAARLLWARFRARCAKSKIRLLGLRVWEPHRDACPHIHALLYVLDHQVAEVDRHLGALCPEPVRPPRADGEPQERVGSNLVHIDRTRSRGSTYVAKYIRKALSAGAGGAEVGRDDDDHLAHYERHRATSSERGWRRYALLGTHGVQRAWQRLATAQEREMEGAPDRPRAVWQAIEDGKWADALQAMGAIRQPGANNHRLRLTYEIRTTIYGDEARRAVAITDTESGWCLPLSRGGSTVVKLKRRQTNNQSVTVAISCPRAAPAAQPETHRPTATTGNGVIYDAETGEIVDEPPRDWWINEAREAECAAEYVRRWPPDTELDWPEAA